MKVGYYASKLINPANHFVVQISNGKPRFGAKPEAAILELFPPLELMHAGLSPAELSERYLAHLDRVGIVTIKAQLARVAKRASDTNREPVLCCFESLKTPGQICHRQIFARWYREKTGNAIAELTRQPELAL